MFREKVFILIFAVCISQADEPASTRSTRMFLQQFHQSEREVFEDLHSLWKPSNRTSVQSMPLPNDLSVSVLDPRTMVNSLKELADLNLESAALTEIPWTDSYWPLYKGMIGIRYADPEFPNSRNFAINFEYIQTHWATDYIKDKDPQRINQLSPAEKYDLLLGDENWTLTRYSWGVGESYLNSSSSIPTWLGICHCWAAAAHMNVQTTQKPVTVHSAQNIEITFYSSDIKALQSLLWAQSSPSTLFVGSRCRESRPSVDSIGRLIEPSCLETNPATFHLLMTNQIGLQKRSLVIDGTYNLEVWNFPVVSYDYNYFNPQTLEPTNSFKYALVPIDRFTIDKFKAFRAVNTKYIAGIVMDETHVVEIKPNRGPQSIAPTKTVRMYYDLELDQDFNIIGGEWYSNSHPDFIWTYPLQAQAISSVDYLFRPDEWLAEQPVPVQWVEKARSASAKGQPVFAIIKALIEQEK